MGTKDLVSEVGGGGAQPFRRAWAVVVLALLAGPPPEGTAADPAAAEDLRLVSREGHAGQVRSVALSTDGSLAVTAGSDKQAILWDLATGRPLRHFLARASFAGA